MRMPMQCWRRWLLMMGLVVATMGSLGAAGGVQVSSAPVELRLRPSGVRFGSGDPIWWLELHQGGLRLLRWQVASGLSSQQNADRRWSPGNGSPLPVGLYRVGRPEPWGRDLWIDLAPQFKTSRSGLGIHHCFPGVGCICVPKRAELDQLAALIARYRVDTLQVLPH